METDALRTPDFAEVTGCRLSGEPVDGLVGYERSRIADMATGLANRAAWPDQWLPAADGNRGRGHFGQDGASRLPAPHSNALVTSTLRRASLSMYP